MNESSTVTLTIDPWWKIWTNPLIIRFVRSRLRLRKSLGWILAVIVFTSFIFFTTYFTSINHELLSPKEAARGLMIPLFGIQSIIMILIGTGSVASGLVQDRIAGTLDYQRLTPMSPLAKIIGYLFGLPIREYLLFALTLPFVFFALWVGRIPLSVSVPVYLVFFTSVLLYHLTGMAAGMIAKKWRFAARLTQGSVILLYIILPLFSNLGLLAFQYLTFRPVLESKLIPLLPDQFRPQNNFLSMSIDHVPFFNFQISSFIFSLTLQGLLILALGLMVHRKWRDQNQHALGKKHGLIMFVAVATMILGNLWPLLNRNTQIELPLLWKASVDNLDQGIAVLLPFILGFFLLGVAMWVLALTTPTHHEVLRGWRRTVKFGQTKIGGWRDEAPSTWVVLGICITTIIALFTEIYLLHTHQFWDASDFSLTAMLRLPLAFIMAVLSFYVCLISLENRRIFLVLLIGWGLPIMVGIFMSAALEWYHPAIYVSSLSPFILIFLGAVQLTPAESQLEMGEYYEAAVNAYWIGLFVQAILIGALIYRWSKLYSKLQAVAKTGSTKNLPSSILYEESE